MADFIEILSPSALKDIKTANDEVIKLVANIDKAGESMRNIKTPSGSDNAIKNLNDKLIRQEKLYASLQIQLQKYAQAQAQTAIKNNQLEASTIRLNKAKETSIKQLEREQVKLEASQQLYSKVQQKLNALSNEYKNLAVKKELSGKLTDAEAKRYDFLSAKITKYDGTLKAVDASMGKYQRNVGNYASGFNPLGNSINQLTREMPAFANSVQTGFMAISNNLPIFFDAMGQAIAQQKALQAEGKPSQSALELLAGSFFSLQTLMSVGITLLTIYGKDIVTWIGHLIKGASALDTLKESQKQLNEINAKGQKNAVEETIKLKSLLAIAKDTELSYKQRKIAVDELQSTYPAYFGNLKKEEIMAGNTAKAEKELTDAILSRAKANAAVEKITENQGKIIDFELRKLELQKEQIQAEKDLQREKVASQGPSGGQLISGANQNQLNAGIRLASIKRELIDIDKESQSLIKTNNTLTSFAMEKQKEAILLDYKEEKSAKAKEAARRPDPESLKALENTISKLKEEQELVAYGTDKYEALGWQINLLETLYNNLNKAKENNNKTTEKENELLSKNNFEKTIKAMEAQMATISPLNESWGYLSKMLKEVKEKYDLLYGSQKNVQQGIELTDEQIYYEYFAWLKLKDATNEYLRTLSSDAFNKAFDNIGISSAKMFFDMDEHGKSTYDKLIEGADTAREKFAINFQAIGDVAQDVFNKIFELSNKKFEVQKENLQKEYEINKAFAGESAAARAEVEAQYQAKQRELKKREFKAHKQQALFNIAIDTAQGIVSALASTPPNLPLSIAIGALGAIQAGLVASQQIPQYWKGTDNANEGWAWTQEKGRELILDKNKKIKSTGSDKGAQLTYLNKGDKVKTASETMDMLMFYSGLNNILTNNGIMMPKVEVNTPSIDLSPVIDAIKNKESVNLNIDKGGLDVYVTNGHERKINQNTRKNFSGKIIA